MANNDGVILTSTLWNQSGTIYVSIDGKQTALTGYTYNQYCPLIGGEGAVHSVTGCSNTADSQLLYYWLEKGYELELSVSTEDFYYLEGDKTEYHASSEPANGEASIETINGLLSGDLSQKLTNGDFIAALNFYCGLKNNSEYADETSTSWYISIYYDGTNADVFEAAGFDSYYFIAADGRDENRTDRHPVSELFFSEYTTTDKEGKEKTCFELTETAFSILRENFDYGEVVRVGVPGHAIYMDGYRFNSTSGEYEYHLNYGWGINSSNYSKWYTVSELKDQQITYITIDISPDIDVLVSNDSSEYTGGSFLRGVERINHIQNDTVTSFEIAEELAGKTISMTELVAFTSDVDVEFINFNINYVSTDVAGIVSERDMCFELTDASIAVNNAEADVAVQGRMLDFSLDNSWIFAGYLESGLSGIASVVTEKDSLLLSDFDSTIREAATGTALGGDSGDDVITISNGSVVFGDIDLGGGSNSLTITNGSLLCGKVAAEKDSLSLKMDMTYSPEEQGALIIADSAERETSLYDAAGGVIDVHFNEELKKDVVYTLVDGYSADVMDNFTVNVTQSNSDNVISLNASAWKAHSFSLSFENGDLVLSYKKEDQILLYYGATLVSSAATMKASLTDQWKMYICGDGQGTADVYSGGMLYVNGGISSESKIYNSGYMAVSGSGSAKNTGIYAGGTAVADNGFMESTVLSGGSLHILANGIVNGTVVYSGGKMTVSAGEADNTVINSGGKMTVAGGVVTSVALNSGGTAVLNGGVVSSAALNSGGKMDVLNGGVLNGAVVSSGAQLIVSSGAAAGNLEISSGAVIGLDLAENTVFQGVRNGSSVAIQDGVLNGYAVENGGYLNVGAGTAASNTVAESGQLNVSADGTVANTVVNSGGIVNIEKGGTADLTSVNSGGKVNVRGSVQSATVNSGGIVSVFDAGSAENTLVYGSLENTGGTVSNTVVGSAGNAVVFSGGKGYNTVVSSGGTLAVSSGGAHYGSLFIDENAAVSAGTGAVIDFSLTGRTVEDDFLMTNIYNISGGGSFTLTVSADISYGSYKLADGVGSFNKTISIGDGSVIWANLTVNGKGWRGNNSDYSLLETDDKLYLSISETDTTPPDAPVASADIRKITRNAVMVTAAFSQDSVLREYSFDEQVWHTYSGGIKFTENGKVYFRALDSFDNVSEVTCFEVSNIDREAPDQPETSSVDVKGTTAEIDWADSVDNGTAGLRGYRVRYGKTSSPEGAGQFVSASSISLQSLTVGTWYYQIQAVDNAGNFSDWSAVQSFTISPAPEFTLQGSADIIQWNNVGGSEYFVEYSSGSGVLSLKTDGNSVDILGLPIGSYSWRVSADGGYWSDEASVSGKDSAGPQKFVSDADGNMDVFFARADGVWDKRHAAGHLGVGGIWQGTSERVLLDGKNRLTDVFGGSTDSNVLLLTDDRNGDALFLDDIFSAFGNEARLTQINEIRAGNGNDIIDLTSQRYDFAGDSIKIYGGLGHDVIWANKQKAIISGDAGNDRIIGGSGNDIISGGSGHDRLHGGGGKDIFCFGTNWGRDEVEQLDDGEITLVIENGSLENWDAENRLYTSGNNSIQIFGDAKVSLVFEADSSLPEGVFSPAASEKIFEDKNKGMLA